MSEFTHLHLHTEYSLLDGVIRIPKLMEKIKNNGMSSVALTDHGVMYGMVEFWKTAHDFGVKPIIGCEMYVAPGHRSERKEIDGTKYYHLLLLAQNKIGLHNLIKLVSIGHLEGMYYRPRVDRESLSKYAAGIICTSACLGSPTSRHLLRKEDDKALDWLKFLQTTFAGRFFLELQRNGYAGSDQVSSLENMDLSEDEINDTRAQQYVNNRLKEWAKQYSLPLVATTDAHFLDDGDQEAQKVLFAIKDGKLITDPTARPGYNGTYIATPTEMQERFSDLSEPLDNTMRIAEMVEDYSIAYDRVQPRFWNLPANKTAEQMLREQTYAGAREKYQQITPELKDRIDYELKVIHDKGYDDYFLVVSDLLTWANSNHILTGVRGSVAGSVVAHCIGIVEVEPIKWELYFERFLNPERPSPPDIDMDIQDSRRDEVIKYVEEKYGKESLAAICAIGRLKTKAAIRDVSRVMGIDLQLADKLSKMVNVLFGKVYPIDKQMDTDPEFKRIIESDPALTKMAGYVRKIEGMARHMSTHACGHLITPGPIIDYSPLQLESGGTGRVITQIEGPWLEEIGLMKFDFLGLRTFTIVSNCITNIKNFKGVAIDYWNIPQDDELTFKLFSRGETTGVFQFESPPMRKYLKELHPETLEDLCFMVAAYRPGPMKYIPDYIARKHGQQKTELLIPEMEPIVGKTYGFAIYQEQVIKIAVDLAGYTMGQADMLRRAMGKKKLDVMKKEEVKFKEGIKARGLPEEIGQKLWEYLLPFADYGFNKAHAACYSVLAYKCAYLKAHYPLEFMAALMYSDIADTERIVIDIEEARHMGYQVVAPDINKSDIHFTTQGTDTIRFGLAAIKNVGEKVCEEIIAARAKYGEFKNLDDFITKVTPRKLNKKAVECLIMAGTFDSFGSRKALLAIMPIIMDRISKEGSIAELGQTGLFGIGQDSDEQVIDVAASELPAVAPETAVERINWEKEYLGIFLSSHPLDEYYWISLKKGFTTIQGAEKLAEGTPVKLVAILSNVRQISTKKDGKRMAFTRIEDVTGSADGVVFPRGFDEFGSKLIEATPLIISGKTNRRDDALSIIVDKIEEVKQYRKLSKLEINICSVTDPEELARIKSCLSTSGDLEITIVYGNRFQPERIVRRAHLSKACVRILRKYVL